MKKTPFSITDIFKRAAVKKKIILLPLCLIQLPLNTYAEDSLKAYGNLIDSSLETVIIKYARNIIISELDHECKKPEALKELEHLPPTGLFISLMKGRRVRACIGNFAPFFSDMEKALRQLARRVVYGDTRTHPLSLAEIETLSVVISFVGPLKEIVDPYSIDFSNEGLYVGQADKGGVLLPGETRTLEYGLRRLIKQHMLDPNLPCRYASFKVVVFDERRK